MKKWIALFLALVMLLTFAACQNETKQPEQSEQVEQPVEDEQISEEVPEEVVPEVPEEETGAPEDEQNEDEQPEIEGDVSEDDAWYYESVSESVSYTDDAGNAVAFTYAYPAFTDADALNGEIEAFCQPYVDEIKNAADNGWSPTILGIRYQTGACGSIRSILIEVMMDADVNIYAVFNYNSALGEKATGSHILEAACIDEKTLVSRTLTVAAEKFIGLYGSVSDSDFYDSQLAMTLSPDAYGKHMPLFFDEAGDLWFVGRVYSLAGAAYYDYPMPVGAES